MIIFSIILSCKERTTDDLEKKELHYIELPSLVKYSFFDWENAQHIRELNIPKRYEYSSKQTFMLPWVYKGYISKKGSDKKYRIDPDGRYGSIYIIYGDSLYMSNQWNIYEKDSLSYTFTRFILD